MRIDPVELKRLSGLMETRDRAADGRDPRAGRASTFNISSPQQLGKVLFEEMKLPAPVKYGKGKTISTAADVLEELARGSRDRAQGAGVPAADQAEGHLRGRAAGADRAGAPDGCTPASTRPARPPGGSRPPTPTCRTFRSARSWGARSARRSSRARAGSCWWPTTRRSSCACWRTCRAIALLVEAFRNGEDIHTRTAAEVLGVPPLMVTPDARRAAKAVNFGIVYGISPFGLAAQLGISRGEAEKYIKNYFARYVGRAAVHRRDHRRGAADGRDARRCSGASGPSRTSTAATRTRAASPNGRP